MAFGLGKLAILENKLDIYEDLSKEMLSKLESAVTSIQDNTNKTAIILERHENRLDEGDKANQAIIEMIKDHQKYDDRMFSNIKESLETLEKKVDENQKMLWMVTMGVSAVVLTLQLLPNLGLELTPVKESAMLPSVERVAWITSKTNTYVS
jgi:seryl-tRNA synthetase|tara:strand:- start:1588 stop:2043 length:456 start_codon:yes stop_codon:yes gene_type:complete